LLLLNIIADCFGRETEAIDVDSVPVIIGSNNVNKDGSSVVVFVDDVVCGNGGG
jgi:hypothetical protein